MKARLVALVPVVALVLAGCSGKEKAAVAPLPPAPSPTVPPPTPASQEQPPPAARAATAQGAAAFVRFYYSQLGQAINTQDTSTIRSLSTNNCVSCKAMADGIDADRAKGVAYEGTITVVAAEAVLDSPERAAVSLLYDAGPLTQRAGASAVPSVAPGRKGITLQVDALRSGSAWRVDKIAGLKR